MIADTGVESVKLPPRSPNLNAHAERFVRSIKESCLDRLISFGAASLRTAIQNFVAHYHGERNHQGLGNRLISPEPGHLGTSGEVQRRRGWAACSTTTTAPLPEFGIQERESAGRCREREPHGSKHSRLNSIGTTDGRRPNCVLPRFPVP